MRVLIGTDDVAGAMEAYAHGFRSLGHTVTTVVGHSNVFYEDRDYDLRLPSARSPSDRWRWKIERLLFAVRAVRSHDLFVYLWGGSGLLPRQAEFPWLRRLGKQIIQVFRGTDGRHPAAFSARFPQLDDPRALAEIHRLAGDGIETVRRLRFAEYHASLIVSQPTTTPLAARRYLHKYLPVKLDEFECFIPGRTSPLIIHAPSRRGLKGTQAIIKAIEVLRLEGLDFEFRVLENADNSQVRAVLRDADIAVDQLFFPLYGKFALEGMASGCAVASCNRLDCEPVPADRPIAHIDYQNVASVLRSLILDRALRMELAHKANAYVRSVHGCEGVVAGMLDALSGTAEAGNWHEPEFFLDRYRVEASPPFPASITRLTEQVLMRHGVVGLDVASSLLDRGLVTQSFVRSVRRNASLRVSPAFLSPDDTSVS